MASLSLENICKIYPNGFEAVKDFNLEINDQDFIIFVGPSGCGKSTTLRMIAGLEDISKGNLKIDGKVVNDVEAKDRDIAMVFQNNIYLRTYRFSYSCDPRFCQIQIFWIQISCLLCSWISSFIFSKSKEIVFYCFKSLFYCNFCLTRVICWCSCCFSSNTPAILQLACISFQGISVFST